MKSNKYLQRNYFVRRTIFFLSVWSAREIALLISARRKRHTENVFHMLVLFFFCKRVTRFPHTITGCLKLTLIIINSIIFNIYSAKNQHSKLFSTTLSPYCHCEYLVFLRDFTFDLSAVSFNTYTMLYLISDLTIFSFTMSPRNDRNKLNRSYHIICSLHTKSNCLDYFE